MSRGRFDGPARDRSDAFSPSSIALLVRKMESNPIFLMREVGFVIEVEFLTNVTPLDLFEFEATARATIPAHLELEVFVNAPSFDLKKLARVVAYANRVDDDLEVLLDFLLEREILTEEMVANCPVGPFGPLNNRDFMRLRLFEFAFQWARDAVAEIDREEARRRGHVFSE